MRRFFSSSLSKRVVKGGGREREQLDSNFGGVYNNSGFYIFYNEPLHRKHKTNCNTRWKCSRWGGEKSKGGIYRVFIFQSHAHPHSAPCTSLGGIINNLTKCWSTTRSWRGKRAQNQLSGRSHCHHEPQQRISLPSKTDAQKGKTRAPTFHTSVVAKRLSPFFCLHIDNHGISPLQS